MNGRTRTQAAKLLARLRQDSAARLVRVDAGSGYELVSDAQPGKLRIAPALVTLLSAAGLIQETEPGRFCAAPVADDWLKRHAAGDLGFLRQHQAIEGTVAAKDGATLLKNLEESPVAALARRPGKDGEPWLAAHAVAAAERLRRDFEVGQLQPRITANWSASVASGKRSGGSGSMADLTDAAMAARLRFERAMDAVGPDFSGLLADVCCFLKGLETVERERQWPARSAKLVLRLALEALARHYGLRPSATGKPSGGGLRHWGAPDYRPEIN